MNKICKKKKKTRGIKHNFCSLFFFLRRALFLLLTSQFLFFNKKLKLYFIKLTINLMLEYLTRH